ncbi:Ig-like domain-containing protein [Methylobacterium durans]|uniref:Carbohydrate-binding/sugar hydrolysis domain-containing protein n=1 Tax=Methylobacterium durans TaxID=2202825 RepID=A0A2U8W830_9HYPH|nr:Ig-like domain-containing protein [Methylobacterium durans]AWN41758.1 hypothetical protein DK389_16140 [Methylobacterium durans]
MSVVSHDATFAAGALQQAVGVATAGPRLVLKSPDLYVNWEDTKPHEILWQSVGNASGSAVRIDLYQDTPQGPALLKTITTQAPDTGRFIWTPAESGIGYGTKGLRIQLSLVSNPAVVDRSVETFAIPENSSTVYVDAGPAGSNRHTGKSADAPLPNPVTALREYDLGAGGTLSLAAGQYALNAPLRISGSQNLGGLGQDQGFAIVGPVGGVAVLAPAAGARFDHLVEINDANYVTLSNLKLSGGLVRQLWVHGGSDHLTLTNVTAVGGSDAAIRIEALGTDSGITLSDIAVSGSAGDGLAVTGPLAVLANLTSHDNAHYGLNATNTGQTRIDGGEVSHNGFGGVVLGNSQALVGGGVAGAGTGLIVHDNGGHGVTLSGGGALANSSVYGNAQTGIVLGNGDLATGNVVFGNAIGISGAFGAMVTTNRVYANAGLGIDLVGGSAAQNVVYANVGGIRIFLGSGTLANNLVYANAAYGIAALNSDVSLTNNTLYQLTGAAVRIENSAARLKNNIVVVEDGTGLLIDDLSQTQVTSDYNLLWVTPTGTGSVGTWQGAARTALAQWQSATLTDAHSLSEDPAFVSPAGSDGVLGYVSASQDGRDDDFHLQSLSGSPKGSGLAPVFDALSRRPLFRSTPVSADAVQSPAIDRADPTDPVGAEAAPNGGFRDLGTFGGTAEASRSAATYVTVTAPVAGAQLQLGRTAQITWQSAGITGSVDISLTTDRSTFQTIAQGVANTGTFSWTLDPSALQPGSQYYIRVSASDGSVSGLSQHAFAIVPRITAYYVNDASLAGDEFSTALGSDANDGLSADHPMASLQALLNAYHPGADDVIYVDAGTYNLTTNIVVDARDATSAGHGLRIQGTSNGSTVLDRGITSPGSAVFDLRDADNLTLANLVLKGGQTGILVEAGSTGSTGLTVRDSQISGVSQTGLDVESTSAAVLVQNVTISDPTNNNGSTGVFSRSAKLDLDQVRVKNFYLGVSALQGGLIRNSEVSGSTYVGIQATNAELRGNDVHNNATGLQAFGGLVSANSVHDNAGDGIFAGEKTTVAANTVFANGTGIEFGYNTGAQAIGNRVFGNTTGLVIGNGLVLGNQIYSNATGLSSGIVGITAEIKNNTIYANTDYGLRLTTNGNNNSISLHLVENTFYQTTGTAIAFAGQGSGAILDSNIVSLGANTTYLSLADTAGAGPTSDNNLLDLRDASARIAAWGGVSYASLPAWYFGTGRDGHSLVGDPLFVAPAGADGQLGYTAAGGDHGADDNLHLQAASPARDAGSLALPYFGESASGNRADIGADGNTGAAIASPAQSVQLTGPAPFDKLMVGQAVQIGWHTTGLLPSEPVVLLAAGSADPLLTASQGRWVGDAAYRTGSSFAASAYTLTDPVDLTNPNTGPAALYQHALQSNSATAGDSFGYSLAVPDGSYTLRLHFVEPYLYMQAGQRSFDILVNGVVVVSHFDVVQQAGGPLKAITLDLPVTLAQGEGLQVSFRNAQGQAIVSGLELVRANAAGLSAPSLRLDVSRDGGATWSTLASGLSAGRYGDGSYSWTPDASYTDQSVQLRLTAVEAGVSAQTSPVRIANAGHVYYVNDASTAGDQYATAIGNDLNTGKSADSPMASLQALLNAYHPGADDVIYVDAGTYNLTTNIVVDARDATSAGHGLRIQGTSNGSTVLDRGITSPGSAVFDLRDADNLTLANLVLKGGQTGILVEAGSTGSTGLTVRDSQISGVSQTGLDVESTSAAVLVQNVTISDPTNNNGSTGVFSRSAKLDLDQVRVKNFYLGVSALQGGLIRNSEVSGSTYVGIQATNAELRGNDVHNNATGLQAFGGLVSANSVHDNAGDGIFAGEKTTVAANTVFANGTGIEFGYNTGAQAIGNRVFGNTTGLVIGNGLVLGNQIYSNATGLSSGIVGITAEIKNNTIYANTDYGLRLTTNGNNNSISLHLVENTFYQTTGTAIAFAGQGSGAILDSNIVSLGANTTYLSLADTAGAGPTSDNNLLDLRDASARIAAWGGVSYASLPAWYFGTGRDGHSLVGDPLFVAPAGADGQLGYTAAGGDHGADDNLHLQAASPARDAGSLALPYFGESASGNRADIGADGNTGAAIASPAQSVQLTGPAPFDKLMVGQAVQIGWHTTGLLPSEPVVLLAAGSADPLLTASQGRWVGDAAYRTGSSFAASAYTLTDPVDLTNPNTGPAALYQHALQSNSATAGDSFGYSLAVPDGSYTLRLHFVEPYLYMQAGQRSFDILVNGVVVVSHFDVVQQAGGPLKAITLDLPVTLAQGEGLQVSFRNAQGQAIVSGLELVRANAAGLSAPSLRLDVSRDGGATWSTLASGLSAGRYGDGSYSWTPDASYTDQSVQLRLTAVEAGVSAQTSPVRIANAGHVYYVNDASTAGDQYATAIGNDLNTGKSADSPMASLQALLNAYHPGADDVIYVDAGTYNLTTNIVVDARDATSAGHGLRIQGTSNGSTVLDRGITSPGSAVFDLRDADNLTLANLVLKGGQTGILVEAGSTGSTGLTVRDSQISGVSQTGLDVESTSAAVLVQNVTISDPTNNNGSTGVFSRSAKLDLDQVRVKNFYLGVSALQGGLIRNSEVSGSTYVGIQATNAELRGNDVHNNATGLQAFGGLVSANSVHDNAGDGIFAGEKTTVAANTVFANGTGIEFGYNTGAQAIGNRVFGNTTGLVIGNGLVLGNQIYSNATGLSSGIVGITAEIKNNTIYANSNFGLNIARSDSLSLVNNTFYQSVGVSVHFGASVQNVTIANNIFAADLGRILSLDAASAAGIQSDYNLFYRGPNTAAAIGELAGQSDGDLQAWQGATGLDAHSLSADPLFTDINGADNVLGGLDGALGGGADDDFSLRARASGIDAGNPDLAPATDFYGQGRHDDPDTANAPFGSGFSIADIGAIEFAGASSDAAAPTITATSLPANGGTTAAAFSSIVLSASEALDIASARSPANFSLVGAGRDGVFDTSDDVAIALAPSYSAGSQQITLSLLTGPLADGSYRLSISGTRALRDTAGNVLDGNADGQGGDNFVTTFTVDRRANRAPVAGNPVVATTALAPVSIALPASDADGDPLSYRIVQGPAHGTLGAIDPATGTVQYLSGLHFAGQDSFVFEVSDGKLGVSQGVVTITVRNAPPTISGTQANQADAGAGAISPFTQAVIADDDAPAQTLTLTVRLDQPGAGVLSNLGAGTWDAQAGVYTLSGSAADLTAALRALVFTPAQPDTSAPVTSSFTISVDDGVASPVIDAQTSVVVSVDRTAPAAPVITTSVAGGQTNASALTVSGTAEAGATVTLFNSGVALAGAVVADSGGVWSTSISLTDGADYNLTAKATDAAGNTSGASTALVFRDDRTAPTAPVITTSVPGGQTNASALTVSGTAEVGSRITLFSNGVALSGTVVADSSGLWSKVINLTDGSDYSLTAKAADAAGNTSVASSPLAIHDDRTAPTAPVITTIVPGGQTNAATLTVSGTAEAGATVTLFNGSVALAGTVTADASGAWSKAVTLSDGSDYSLTAKATDAAGNTGTASAPLSFHVDRVAPTAPVITTGVPAQTSASTLTVGGTAEAGATVTLFNTGVALGGTVVADGSGVWSTVISLADGADYSLTAATTDAAGNTSAVSGALTFHADRTAPATPIIVTAVSGGQTNASVLTLSGTAEAGATITLFNNGAALAGPIAANASGVWSASVTLTDGADYSLTAKATDAAGNTSAASAALSFHADRTAPAAPAITTTVTGGQTSVRTLTISGSAEAGSTITLLNNGVALAGTVVADASGAWSRVVTLASGTDYSLTAQATDAAGNSSAASPPLAFHVTGTALATPIITTIVPGGQTNAATLTVSGTAEAGSTVTLFNNGVALAGTVVADGSGLWSKPVTLTDGVDYSLTAVAADAAGNSSAVSAALAFHDDRTAPLAPVITTSLPGETSASTLTVSGTAETGSTVTLLNNGVALAGSVVADANGAWSKQVALTDGADYSLTAKATDAAGNLSLATAPLIFHVDRTAPAVPVIATHVPAQTNAAAVTISGTAEAGTTITLFNSGTALAGPVVADALGAWSKQISLADGADYSLTATATDAAGNTSSASAALAFHVDRIAPATPAITTTVAGGQTNASTLTISGTAEAGSTVTLLNSGASLPGTVVADASGRWSQVLSLVDGTDYSLTARAADAAGNVSAASPALSFHVDRTAPAAPVITTSVRGGQTSASTLTISGTAEAGSTITLFNAGTALPGTVVVGSSGAWSKPVSLIDGADYSLTAKATDTVGNTSAASPALAFHVDRTAPAAPVISTSVPGGQTNAATLTISGMAEAGSTVTVLNNGAALAGTVVADAGGAWSKPVSLTDGADYSLTATATDAAGNASAASAALSFHADRTAPTAPVITTSMPAQTSASTLTVSGQAEAGTVVTLFNAGVAVAGTVVADAAGMWTKPFSLVDGTDYSLTAKAVDAAGNSSAASAPLAFHVDQTPPSPEFGTLTQDVHSGGGAVYALYSGLLGRAPDTLGLEYWADQIAKGASPRDLGQLLLSSPEGQARAGALGNRDFVQQLYQATLHRQADSAGLDYWAGQLDRGATRIDVALGFVFSDEHVSSLRPAFDAGLFVPDKQASDVARLYYTMLNRAPDAGGLQFWTDQLKRGGSLSDLARAFLGTPENVSKYGSMSNSDYVDALYVNALGRHADAGGRAYWTDLLNRGTSRADLAVLLTDSAEAHSVHLGQIEQGGQLV